MICNTSKQISNMMIVAEKALKKEKQIQDGWI
jgi:hypothetical protein